MNNPHLHRTITAIVTAAAISAAPIVHGDGVTPVFQYQRSLGNGEPATTFYVAYQPDGRSQAADFETDPNPGAFRVPVYSTDSGERTTFSTFSAAMRTAPSEKTTAGDVLAGLAAITLYIGLPLYSFAKELEKAYEVDLSGIEYPDIDPELLGLAPPNADGTHEQQ